MAAVGICGYAINDQKVCRQKRFTAWNWTKRFLKRNDQLFSPDGYHGRSLLPPFLSTSNLPVRRSDWTSSAWNWVSCKITTIHWSKTTSYSVFKTAFPDGTLPALNDSSKTISINDEGVIMATSVCYHRYEQTETLLGMANHQQNVWVHASGKTLSDAVEAADEIKPFNWGSLFVEAALKVRKAALVFFVTVMSKTTIPWRWSGLVNTAAITRKYHSALDHGHYYDGLHLSVFNRGHEVLHDYGFGRWVNVRAKFGGRYIQRTSLTVSRRLLTTQ